MCVAAVLIFVLSGAQRSTAKELKTTIVVSLPFGGILFRLPILFADALFNALLDAPSMLSSCRHTRSVTHSVQGWGGGGANPPLRRVATWYVSRLPPPERTLREDSQRRAAERSRRERSRAVMPCRQVVAAYCCHPQVLLGCVALLTSREREPAWRPRMGNAA